MGSNAHKPESGEDVSLEALLALFSAMKSLITKEIALTQSHVHQLGLAGAIDRLAERWIPDFSQSGARARAHQSSQVITGLVIVIVVSVSVIIVSKFNQSLGGVENDSLSQAQNSVLEAFADMVGLIAPLLLIIIAVVIVAYVQKMRTG